MLIQAFLYNIVESIWYKPCFDQYYITTGHLLYCHLRQICSTWEMCLYKSAHSEFHILDIMGMLPSNIQVWTKNYCGFSLLQEKRAHFLL